ncbi:c-type cytochrome [Sinorhizobium alkalisoli]|uniref:Cytochrome C556 n=1 Tax=Sinorhizobium alkalisoli TaxID=1752398 RepID=A0A1E3V720_9HYPH|nr:cytochrome c [Sinorhizobium alkalisoli]MCG5479492.1 cytochrome c [Sinorhizobium alkalisoli]ODR89442.1 cytochrome C556 [Sinorhizobium alkalisoli]QFI65479.1 Cytochrome C-556 [Sinorhizobium alkalisoli]
MKMRAFALAAVLAGLGVTAVTAADEPQEVRQQLMKKVGQAAGALSGIAKGEKPYDAEVVKASLTTISDTVKVFPNHFPPGSETGMETEASPKIWQNMEDFKAKAAKLGGDAEMFLAELPSDSAGVGAALGVLGKDCGSCHETYRLKKE